MWVVMTHHAMLRDAGQSAAVMPTVEKRSVGFAVDGIEALEVLPMRHFTILNTGPSALKKSDLRGKGKRSHIFLQMTPISHL